MMKREDWSLIQQTVVSSLGELQVPRDLKDEAHQNISIALQFIKKPARQMVPEKFKADINTDITRDITQIDTTAIK